ncbi:hypothetical protein [Streptomyces cellulosae]|uniref:hypothetical protein n=1 Tax=Streptomyces cellulosae TaxID=1968 RepID=UPI0004CA74A8
MIGGDLAKEVTALKERTDRELQVRHAGGQVTATGVSLQSYDLGGARSTARKNSPRADIPKTGAAAPADAS